MLSLRRISRKILNSSPYKTLIFCFVLISVFMSDFVKGWLEPSADGWLETLMLLAFIFLLSELIFTFLADRHWWKRGSFWLFTFATLTILFDMDWFVRWAFMDMGTLFPLIPVKLMRLIRLVSRLGRMMRIIRVFLNHQLFTLKARLTGSTVDRGDQLMTMQLIKRQTGENRARIWNKIESVISYGTMLCFLFLYLMISGLGIMNTAPVSPAFLKGEILLQSGMNGEKLVAFMENTPDILFLKIEDRIFLNREAAVGSLRLDEILSYEDSKTLFLVDNSALNRQVHRHTLGLTLIFFIAMSFMNLFTSWVIRKYSLEFSGVLKTLARALDERDSYTSEHSKHVASYARSLAEAMGMNKKEQDVVHLAGELHDIGKIGVPEGVLHKNGPLDEREFSIMKKHPVQGIEILNNIVNLDQVILAAYYHHEKYNGKGYPEGLEKDRIPRVARILSVCDVWDALTTDRPYRDAMSFEKAKEAIMKMRGEDLPPDEVDAFFRHEVWKAL